MIVDTYIIPKTCVLRWNRLKKAQVGEENMHYEDREFRASENIGGYTIEAVRSEGEWCEVVVQTILSGPFSQTRHFVILYKDASALRVDAIYGSRMDPRPGLGYYGHWKSELIPVDVLAEIWKRARLRSVTDQAEPLLHFNAARREFIKLLEIGTRFTYIRGSMILYVTQDRQKRDILPLFAQAFHCEEQLNESRFFIRQHNIDVRLYSYLKENVAYKSGFLWFL
jgi:hypothetical protein